ncbi:MAG: hypothetical protein QNJ68_10040 [Microcoleaceae cyanobacterium MO_207.B10]|nr:hypothetical protein [Microcoleaceae cyanobacterium MO_207.B10]
MPEAELPGNQHLPEKNDPVNSKELDQIQNLDKKEKPLASEPKFLGPELDDVWETVDFPNAIPVDSIPVLEMDAGEPAKNLEAENSTKAQEKNVQGNDRVAKVISLTSESRHIEELKSENIMEALHQCNRELIDRVTELEAALEECQKTLENQERLLEERTQELASTQQQVTRLFYKLELCNQIIQRQEVLVESLTDKWEQSQQQQAQMERECALTQQSYHKQSYNLKDLENSCQELRSRLYRQQQQTLHFKAALERCLEMPGRMGVVNQPQQEETNINNIILEKSPAREINISNQEKLSIDKNPFDPELQSKALPLVNSQPVTPWSPPPKPTEEQETIISKREETIAKMSFGKKLDLPQGLDLPQQSETISTTENSIPEAELYSETTKTQLNPTLPSFSRIAEVPSYELDESEQLLLGETEASEEYVVIENDISPQNQQPDEEITPENYIVEEFIGQNSDEFNQKVEENVKTERISWNISTGNWNISEYRVKSESEDQEDFPEVPEIIQQDRQQTGNKLDLPKWNLPMVEPVVPVSKKNNRPSLAAIDLPTFPKIPIDDHPSAVGS